MLGADAPESVHFCDFPAAREAHAGDARIQQSVDRMQAVIELGRVIREKRNKPLKTPLKSLVVVHSDADFLTDIQGGWACAGACARSWACAGARSWA